MFILTRPVEAYVTKNLKGQLVAILESGEFLVQIALKTVPGSPSKVVFNRVRPAEVAFNASPDPADEITKMAHPEFD